jgi:hypothetical protein
MHAFEEGRLGRAIAAGAGDEPRMTPVLIALRLRRVLYDP